MIAESLAGKRIAITGATGFVGTALVERLLRGVPDCELILLVRNGKRTPAATRTQKELLKNDAFDRLRVLTTELKRLIATGAPVSLRLGVGPELDESRLACALWWV